MASPEPPLAEEPCETEPSHDEPAISAPDQRSPGDCGNIWSCDCCIYLLESGGGVKHAKIQQAAQQGCNRCWIVAQAIQVVVEERKLAEFEDWSESTMILRRKGTFSCRDVRFGVCPVVEIFVEQSTTITDKLLCEGVKLLDVKRNITVKGVPEECLQFASDALHKCVRNHERCRGNSRLRFIPRRLVDVGNDGTVKVIDDAPSSVPVGSKYVALTYCWGPQSVIKDKMLTLTAQNLEQMGNGVSVDELPRVFRDAIQTTRSLQIRYLWIDALCIAQGDEEEWRTESLRMREVYAGAHVTISADAASTCDESFLEMPNRGQRKAVDIGTRRFGSRILARLAHKYWKEPECKLHARGWTLQEALLSPRLIHFGFSQVDFSCIEEEPLREDGDSPKYNGSNASILNDLRQGWFRPSSRQHKRSRYPNPRLFKLWRDLVTNYTGRDLSEPDDALPAISGLASQLQQQLHPPSRYCAGLWEEDFVGGLCWFGARGKTPRTPPTKSPSWSWVSYPGQVKFPPIDASRFAQLVALSPSPKDGDFGHTDSMEATIEGPLLDVVLERHDGRLRIVPVPAGLTPFGGIYFFWYMDNQELESLLLRPIWKRSRGISKQRRVMAHLLTLGTSDSSFFHLVLVRSTTTSNTHRRVGLCDSAPRGERSAFDSWLSSFEQKRITIV
ncbi:hypothetical protein AYL99_10486 [Fonsecaea erecta]|uniref:Heterokaryon incompatibility domain-containing protein n=1 Tax=Fonsecaea erecta TaxID=1367422 RepID=A0A178Z8K4_9EURO|nr:hypothetical protein AYL99_10486 [Fonsecaea erecta]OAP55513.1 hypothetical protein AYL99_10486 [Fonsecaea erecta]